MIQVTTAVENDLLNTRGLCPLCNQASDELGLFNFGVFAKLRPHSGIQRRGRNQRVLAHVVDNLYVDMLIAAKYIEERKFFANRIPRTEYRLTTDGRTAYHRYIAWWKRTTGL